MRQLILLVALLGLAACEVNVPISQFDLHESACQSGPATFTWKGETRGYGLVLVDDPDEIYTRCGPKSDACIVGNRTIFVPPGPRCLPALAHELNHLFGQHWVDGPKISEHSPSSDHR